MHFSKERNVPSCSACPHIHIVSRMAGLGISQLFVGPHRQQVSQWTDCWDRRWLCLCLWIGWARWCILLLTEMHMVCWTRDTLTLHFVLVPYSIKPLCFDCYIYSPPTTGDWLLFLHVGSAHLLSCMYMRVHDGIVVLRVCMYMHESALHILIERTCDTICSIVAFHVGRSCCQSLQWCSLVCIWVCAMLLTGSGALPTQ